MDGVWVARGSPRSRGLVQCVRVAPAITVPTKTRGAATEQTKGTLSGRPGRLNRNERVTCFQRWISRYMEYQLHTQAAPLIAATTRHAEGPVRLMGDLLSAGKRRRATVRPVGSG